MRPITWIIIALSLTALFAATALANGDAAVALPSISWVEAVKSATWPGAFAVSMFSPVGRALAGLIQALTPTKAQTVSGSAGGDPGVAAALSDLANAVTRNNEVQAKTVEALQQIQVTMAVMLELQRTLAQQRSA